MSEDHRDIHGDRREHVTLAAIRLTPDRVKFWRQIAWLIAIIAALGGFFVVVGAGQYMARGCPAEVTLMECVRMR